MWLVPIADERVGVQLKLCDPLRTRAIPERFCGGDSQRRGAISSVWIFTFYLTTFIIYTETAMPYLFTISATADYGNSQFPPSANMFSEIAEIENDVITSSQRSIS